MKRPIADVEFVRSYLAGVFAQSLHAERIRIARGRRARRDDGRVAGGPNIGQSVAQACGLISKHVIKQVDHLAQQSRRRRVGLVRPVG